MDLGRGAVMSAVTVSRAAPVLSSRSVSARLRRLHDTWTGAGAPDEWRLWYRVQGGALSARAVAHGLPVSTVAAVAAALSPRRRWSKNLQDLDYVLGGGGPDGFTYTRANYWRAVDALLGYGVGDGPKVNAFLANLLGDEDQVTIDSWMLQCVGWPEGRTFTGAQYVILADQIRDLAGRMGVAPAQLQALTWCAARGSAV